jgi:4-aminobutyrate aminotransferase-like enzyme
MIGVEFDPEIAKKPKIATLVVKECINEGLLLLTASTFEVIRFIPPLNVSSAEINTALELFEKGLQKALA